MKEKFRWKITKQVVRLHSCPLHPGELSILVDSFPHPSSPVQVGLKPYLQWQGRSLWRKTTRPQSFGLHTQLGAQICLKGYKRIYSHTLKPPEAVSRLCQITESRLSETQVMEADSRKNTLSWATTQTWGSLAEAKFCWCKKLNRKSFTILGKCVCSELPGLCVWCEHGVHGHSEIRSADNQRYPTHDRKVFHPSAGIWGNWYLISVSSCSVILSILQTACQCTMDIHPINSLNRETSLWQRHLLATCQLRFSPCPGCIRVFRSRHNQESKTQGCCYPTLLSWK